MSKDLDEKTEILGGGDPRRQPRLGRYRLERRIGSGGMAEIFLARADGPGGFEKQVVIKRIRPALAGNDRFVEMFLREARMLAALDHPNIVRIFELDEHGGEYFLALEYLEGLSLREVVERFWHQKRPVPIEPLIRVVADAALGLEYAHNFKDLAGQSARLVHRDVSPDNLFLTTAGVTKVLDFGIAKNEGEHLTQQGELKGKIPFMSPEQMKGEELDGRTDLWSVGVCLYWFLAGRRPFDGVTDVHTMKAILEDAPKPLRLLNPRVPASLDAVVSSCLEKEPRKRISSAAALHDALMTLLVGLPRGWPAPDIVVGQAMKMPGIEHEAQSALPAAVNVVPWPDRQSAVPLPDVSAGDDTRAHKKATLATSSSDDSGPPPTQKIPVWAPQKPLRSADFDPSTEVIQSAADLPSTDEHRRAEPHAPESSSASSPEKSGEGAFLVNSDPIIDVERVTGGHDAPRVKVETLQAPVDPSAPTLQQLPRPVFDDDAHAQPLHSPPLELSKSPSHQGTPVVNVPAPVSALEDPTGVDRAATVPRPVSLAASEAVLDQPDEFYQKETALVQREGTPRARPAARAPSAALPAPPKPSHALPVFGGISAALVVVIAVLWGTGALERIYQEKIAIHLAHDDAGVVVVDSGPAEVALDAGAAPAVDAGVVDVRPPPPKTPRTVQVIGPSTVQWLGPSNEVLAKGNAQLKLPPGTKHIFALDLARSVKTRIAVERTARIDYAKLPKGRLAIRARPYADVFFGPERVGRTPIAVQTVVAGTYQVKLQYKKKKKIVDVEVRPGKQAVVAHDFGR